MYGIFFGRFQPFHLGHISVIQKIVDDGLIPFILIGSSDQERTDKNPYSYIERKTLIQSIFPEIQIKPLPDVPGDNDTWVANLQATIESHINDSYTIYTHNKPTEQGKYGLPADKFITDYITFAPKVDVSDICDVNVNATDIRESLYSNVDKLHQTTFQQIELFNSSLYHTVDTAFKDAIRKKYDCIYIFVDLHSTLVEPNYSHTELPTTLYPEALATMQMLSQRKDCKLILYSCSYAKDLVGYFNYFSTLGIHFNYINENPEVTNSTYGSYDQKPFYNILLDDKAGFNPYKDWKLISDSFSHFNILEA